MDNMDLVVESFIGYCDDMLIADEGFNLLQSIKKALQKLKDMIMTLLRKIKGDNSKIYMSREAYQCCKEFIEHYNIGKKAIPNNYIEKFKSGDLDGAHSETIERSTSIMKQAYAKLREIDWPSENKYSRAKYIYMAEIDDMLKEAKDELEDSIDKIFASLAIGDEASQFINLIIGFYNQVHGFSSFIISRSGN